MMRRQPEKPGSIYVSYRRDDTAGYAGRICDRLVNEFGSNRLFMDVDRIGLGIDFIDTIKLEVSRCWILIAIIGPNWLDAIDESGSRRLDDPKDLVRLEIATALQRGIRVIPIFLNTTAIPNSSKLPDDLKELTKRNGFLVRHTSFHYDMDEFIRRLKDFALAPSASEDGEQKSPTKRSAPLSAAERRKQSAISRAAGTDTALPIAKQPRLRVKSKKTITPSAHTKPDTVRKDKKKIFSQKDIQAMITTFFSLHLTSERGQIKPITDLKRRHGLNKHDWEKLADQLSDLHWMKEIAVRLAAHEMKDVRTPIELTHLIWGKMDPSRRGHDTAAWSDL